MLVTLEKNKALLLCLKYTLCMPMDNDKLYHIKVINIEVVVKKKFFIDI